jgi:hypothetical protein
MLRFKFLLAAAVILAVSRFWAQTPLGPELPPGDMQAKARTACLECHDARIILQQRLSKATWQKEVEKMMKWGALVEPTDENTLVDYLSSNFPPDRPAEPAPRVARPRR